MFSDTITLTVNGVAKALARIKSEGTSSQYETADGLFAMRISHAVTKSDRVRSEVRVTQRKVVTDPITAQPKDYDDFTIAVLIDRPFYGFSDAEIQYLEAAIEAFLDATSLTKLYGRES